ncbi:MAG: hypothetical protein Q7R64_00480 [bacterium]|nr:hypothetical protein [bacterium]
MTVADIKILAQQIVAEARKLSVAHTNEGAAPVSYACIFAHSQSEYQEMVKVVGELGPVVKETPMGPIFHITPLTTESGVFTLLKVRRPEDRRPQLGYADFTVSNYERFKGTYLGTTDFRLITRPQYEMVELSDKAFNVLAYYAFPSLPEVLNTKG